MDVLWYGARHDFKRMSKVWSDYADYAISIGDPFGSEEKSTPPWAWKQFPHSKRLRLEFFDYDNPIQGAPTTKDVEKLIAFCESRNNQGRVLIHCHAGISRSSAAAIIVETLGKDSRASDMAIHRFMIVHPECHPNFRMLVLADAITNNQYGFTDTYLRHEDKFIASYRKRYKFDTLYSHLRKIPK